MLAEEQNEKLASQKTMFEYQLKQGRERVMEVEELNQKLKADLEEAQQNQMNQSIRSTASNNNAAKVQEEQINKLKQQLQAQKQEHSDAISVLKEENRKLASSSSKQRTPSVPAQTGAQPNAREVTKLNVEIDVLKK